MKTETTPERAGSLVIELAARTAIIDGERIVLPPTEFSLLALLAARPGQVVPLKELMATAFGDSAAMTPDDLHHRIWRLRRLIGDKDRKHKIVANRRGVGYLIDLPPSAVRVIEGVIETEEIVPAAIHLDEPDGWEAQEEDSRSLRQGEDAPVASRRQNSRARPRIGAVLAMLLLATIALGGSWVAGYQLSKRGGDVLAEQPPATETVAPQDHAGNGSDTRRSKRDEDKGKKDRKGSGATRSAGDTGSSGSGNSSGSASSFGAAATGDVSSTKNKPQGPKGGSGGGKDKPPPPPPQPDASLYHLHNPDTGDHFVTTSSSMANQKQAQGYVSTIEGKVFSSQQKGTVAISLDSGTAHVYRSRDAAPSGVSVTELYRLTTEGDLFYTRSSSVANQAQAQGWNRSLAGYVQ